MIEKAKETLKSKGVNKIRSTFSDKWPINSVKSHYTEKEIVQHELMLYQASRENTIIT